MRAREIEYFLIFVQECLVVSKGTLNDIFMRLRKEDKNEQEEERRQKFGIFYGRLLKQSIIAILFFALRGQGH